MRVLISAYACEPGKGSEPEVGLQTVLAAAAEHEVWVITRENNLPSLSHFLQDHALRDRIHIVGLDVGGVANRVKKLGGQMTLHWYYDRWQRSATEIARGLDREHDFDVLHHVTFSSYWTRVALAAVDKPLIWGPVGGGVKPPMRLLPVMGLKGALGDLVRISSRPLLARVSGSRGTARRASVVLAQNPESASILHTSNDTAILPNALLAAQSIGLVEEALAPVASDAAPRFVMAGRLIGLKAPTLAVMAMKHVQHPSAALFVYGDGPQRARLVRLAERLGMKDRVHFLGEVPRAELLAAMSRASVLIHPALHEEAGFVVAEALALGAPVVAINRGGPPVISGYWPQVPSRFLTPSTPAQTARALAVAIDDVIGLRAVADPVPTQKFRDVLLDAYAEAAAGRAT